jgi:mRNA interferase MazF
LPGKGEVWLVNLNPACGHEQRGRRPALIVSNDQFNNGPAGLVVVVPMTSTRRRIPLHVEIEPPEGGVRETSFAKCEDVRSISTERLEELWGRVSPQTLQLVADRLRILLDL